MLIWSGRDEICSDIPVLWAQFGVPIEASQTKDNNDNDNNSLLLLVIFHFCHFNSISSLKSAQLHVGLYLQFNSKLVSLPLFVKSDGKFATCSRSTRQRKRDRQTKFNWLSNSLEHPYGAGCSGVLVVGSQRRRRCRWKSNSFSLVQFHVIYDCFDRSKRPPFGE